MTTKLLYLFELRKEIIATLKYKSEQRPQISQNSEK